MDEHAVAEALGRNIRALREKQGLSRDALAARAGLHVNFVGSVERAETNASVHSVLRLAGALDIDVAKLLGKLPVVKQAKGKKGDDAAIRADLESILSQGDPDARLLVKSLLRDLLRFAVKRKAKTPKHARG